MPRKRLDESSGAILCFETREEEDARLLRDRVKTLEDRVSALEKILEKGGINLYGTSIQKVGADR